jgi:hypothetical protein
MIIIPHQVFFTVDETIVMNHNRHLHWDSLLVVGLDKGTLLHCHTK